MGPLPLLVDDGAVVDAGPNDRQHTSYMLDFEGNLLTKLRGGFVHQFPCLRCRTTSRFAIVIEGIKCRGEWCRCSHLKPRYRRQWYPWEGASEGNGWSRCLLRGRR